MDALFVDPAVVNERFERLRVVLEHSAEIKHQERVGRVEEVIIEGISKRNEGVMTGRTRQNKLLHFPSAEPIRVGSYANVLVTSAARHFLRGELQEITAAPTHKVRLSVSAL
jgi:tRNA-2-methylthio-N6-dimethylallyladenosine synthase